jgi:hypothetical protein
VTHHDPPTAPDHRRRRRRAWGATTAALVLLGTGSMVAWGSQAAEPPSSPPERSTAPAAAAAPVRDVPAPAAAERAPLPTAVRVPSIGVSTPLLRLGLRQDDTVEVPVAAEDAGWFELGARPGDLGSAVILGHVDSVEGPAVFARLSELGQGQRVEVDRADGSTATFEVKAVETVPNGEFPAQRVYGSHGTRDLNLITCGGTYDAANGGYQSNVIVYTRLVRTSGAQAG